MQKIVVAALLLSVSAVLGQQYGQLNSFVTGDCSAVNATYVFQSGLCSLANGGGFIRLDIGTTTTISDWNAGTAVDCSGAADTVTTVTTGSCIPPPDNFPIAGPTNFSYAGPVTLPVIRADIYSDSACSAANIVQGPIFVINGTCTSRFGTALYNVGTTIYNCVCGAGGAYVSCAAVGISPVCFANSDGTYTRAQYGNYTASSSSSSSSSSSTGRASSSSSSTGVAPTNTSSTGAGSTGSLSSSTGSGAASTISAPAVGVIAALIAVGSLLRF